MKRRRSVLAVALALGVCAPDATAETTGASSAPPTQPASGTVHPTKNPETPARAVIVVGGIMVSVGFALSWTGIVGLVWEATQHQSLPWAGPVGITSIPVEIVGSVLVLGGALDLDRQRAPGVMSIEPPWVGHLGPPVTLPLLRGEL